MKNEILASFFLLCMLSVGCENESNLTNRGFDELEMDYYYEAEIFEQPNIGIYDDWELYEISGGISGHGQELNFDILKIRKYGIYAFIDDDEILEYGRIQIDGQTHETLRIIFVPHPDSEVFMWDNKKNVVFQGQDIMLLYSDCCDRFNYHFVRKE